MRLVAELEELNVFWLEDFSIRRTSKAMPRCPRGRRTLRIAAGEQLAGLAEFERLALAGKAHVLQPDLSRCGG